MLVPEFLYYVELVVWYLKLLVALSVLVIGFVIRRKWRSAVEREDEIKRLMILAAEEAARAEFEAEAVGYFAVNDGMVSREVFGGVNGMIVVDKVCPEVVRNDEVGADDVTVTVYRCAVCLSPTTTRCARCKSARYCSAKCQIFHWRKGHKDECHPPCTVDQPSDFESYPCIKVVDQELDETRARFTAPDDRPLKNCHPHLEGDEARGADQTEQLSDRNDGMKIENFLKVNSSSSTASFTSLSSDSSFSIFSDSSDDASATASRSLNDREKSVGNQHKDISNKAKSIAKRSDENKPCDVKNSKAVLSYVNLQQSTLNQSDSQRVLYDTISSNAKESGLLVAKSSASDFWDRVLDYRWSEPVKVKPNDTKDDFSDIKASSRRSSGSFTNIENNSQLEGNSFCTKESDVFKKIDIVSSEVEMPLETSPTMSRPARSADTSVSGASVNKEVGYSSSASITSAHIVASKEKAQKVSNSRFSSSSKAGRALNSTSSIVKPRCSFSDNADETVNSVKEVNACQDNGVSHLQNASRSSLFAERLGHAMYSRDIEITEHPFKSRMVGSIPSNSIETHSSVAHEKKMSSTVAKTDTVKSNSNVATSKTSYSVKAVNSLKSSTWKAVEHFKASKQSRDCGSDEKHDDNGLFSFELFKSLYGWNKVELQPRGLVNCGNSCYANAVLQCLSFTPPLTAYLLQGLHSKNCTKRDWCFTCEFENLILKAKEGNSPISPIRIISHLPKIGSHLSNGREEDAHEFLRYVVDTMQYACIKEATNKVVRNVNEETTLLGLTFGGYLQSKIRCMKCGHKSERSERIMDLSVEIEGSIQSLVGALSRFTRPETLEAENKYNCTRCKSYQKAIKQLTVFEAPNILTIVLKRFQAGKYGKLSKWIDFPEVLDMSPFMSRKSNDKAPIYKLYGVVVHLDTMNAAFSGHYVCYVKNIQNKWFKIDDAVVKAVDFGKVKEQAAYMLLYARCLPKAPKYLPMAGPSLRHDHAISSKAYRNGRYEKIETDSCSDNSSLFSSGSDANSCSTTSSNATEPSSTDDLSDLIFGYSGHELRNPWTSSDTSSHSASPKWY